MDESTALSAHAALTAAVEESRRIRGTIMLAPEGQADRWCAVCAAVDGALELRVGEPRRRWWRRGRSEAEVWLIERGFLSVIDAWTLPVSRSASADYCARTLCEALESAVNADLDRRLRRELVHPGIFESDVPPAAATLEEHLAAALRGLTTQGRGRIHIEGGTPAVLWAWVWVLHDERQLLVEHESYAAAEAGEHEWREPLTLDGAGIAARELARRIRGHFPSASHEPLFIAFIDG